MKEVRISLSEQRLAEIEAEIAGRQFVPVSELVDGALQVYFEPAGLPTEAEMIAELAAMRDDLAGGDRLLDSDEVRQIIRDSLAE